MPRAETLFEDTVIVRNTDDLILCTVRRDALDFYLALTDGVLVRVFDIPRSHGWEAFSGRDLWWLLSSSAPFLGTRGTICQDYRRGRGK